MDAAQAEKMREREAMENVKLLYHDNLIEMTPVSIMLTCERYCVVHKMTIKLVLFDFVILFINTVHYIKIHDTSVVTQFVTISVFKHEIIKNHLIFFFSGSGHR